MVRLTLSKDKKALCYREINPKNSFKAAVKGKRSISFESMKGFLYGALTQTFINRRQGCLQAMSKEKMKVMKQYNIKHSFGNNDSGTFSHILRENKQVALRKMKTMKLSKVDDLFYSWECVSLVLDSSTVDFVIKDT